MRLPIRLGWLLGLSHCLLHLSTAWADTGFEMADASREAYSQICPPTNARQLSAFWNRYDFM